MTKIPVVTAECEPKSMESVASKALDENVVLVTRCCREIASLQNKRII